MLLWIPVLTGMTIWSLITEKFTAGKNFPTRLLWLMRGELSFLPGKESHRPNYPTYAWRTVFFHGQESHRSKLSYLCVANCLFPWQKNFPTLLLRLIRGELSFFPGQEYHRSKLSDLCVANRLFPWQKNFPTRLLRLMRGEPSFSLAKKFSNST